MIIFLLTTLPRQETHKICPRLVVPSNSVTTYLGGGFKYFHPYLAKIPNLTNMFQMG